MSWPKRTPSLLCLLACGLILTYQNCGKGFETGGETTYIKPSVCDRVPYYQFTTGTQGADTNDASTMASPTQSLPPNDPRYGEQTHMAAIQYTEAYDFFFNSITAIQQDTIVAILDTTGFDLDHEDLRNQKWVNYIEAIGQAGVDDDGNGYVDDISGYNFNGANSNSDIRPTSPTTRHGTLVAGFLGAQSNNNVGVSGVMSKHIKIIGLKTTASPIDITRAFQYAIDRGAKFISISIALGDNADIKAVMKSAVSHGITIFAAAGNSAGPVAYPALYAKTTPGIIAVGSVDTNPAGLGNKCAESSYDPTYVLSAPGCDGAQAANGLLSTSPETHSSYFANHGTSFAAPMMAGAAAAAFSYVRDNYGCELAPEQIQTLLIEGSKNYSALNPYMKEGKTLNMLSLKDKILSYFQP